MSRETQVQKFQSGSVLLVSLAHLIHDIYTSFLAQALPLIIEKLGISATMAGLLSIFQRIPNYFNFLIGILAENVQARYFVIFAPAIATISMSMIGVAPVYTLLAVCLFISGIGSTLFHVPAPVMIRKLSGNRVGMGMSFYMFGGELARTLGPLVIVGVVSLWGFEGTWKLMPFGIIASALLYFRLRKIEISSSLVRQQVKINYWKLFLRFLPAFIGIAGITLFRAAMKSSLTFYLPTFITGKTGQFGFAGISLAVLQLAGAFGSFYAGTISDRIGRKTTLIIIALVSPVLMWVFIQIEGIMTIPVLVIMGFFLVTPTPVILAMINEFDTEQLSFINGIYMTLSFIMQSVGVLLVGVFTDLVGIESTFRASALIAFGAVFFIFLLPGRREKSL